jgi:hypothetical protein
MKKRLLMILLHQIKQKTSRKTNPSFNDGNDGDLDSVVIGQVLLF